MSVIISYSEDSWQLPMIKFLLYLPNLKKIILVANNRALFSILLFFYYFLVSYSNLFNSVEYPKMDEKVCLHILKKDQVCAIAPKKTEKLNFESFPQNGCYGN